MSLNLLHFAICTQYKGTEDLLNYFKDDILKGCLSQTLNLGLTVEECLTGAFSIHQASPKYEIRHLDYQGMNLLHLAIIFHPDIVRSLLSFLESFDKSRKEKLTGLMINQQTDITKKTALHLAMESSCKPRDRVELVRMLVQHGADPNYQNEWKEVPLHLPDLPGIVDILTSDLDK